MASFSIGGVEVSSQQLTKLAAPFLILMILAMMILPLPAIVLDLLFTFNIALALMVLLAALYTSKPLDFLAFPTILLLTTLLRLSLNVASTRVVLLKGHTGPDAAGKVIEAFAHFLVGGNFAVGIVVFAILMVINFVVVTKGAGRIAEVGARFTLDAMPGKQMAIDADLNAGLIGEPEAKKRRMEVSQEAEFYGSMDGASKFVRGDAIAGILILFINIIGGLLVGMLQHNLSFEKASNFYVLLAIGDGLVAQIPALVISVAAGLVVSRVGDGMDITGQLSRQFLKTPQVLIISGGVLILLGIIPGMPHLSFLFFAAGLIYLGWYLHQKEKRELQQTIQTQEAPAESEIKPVSQEASWDDVQLVDTIGLEVGYRLIPLVDKTQDGDLLKRIKGIRKKFANEIGFLPPSVHIRDNLELRPNTYRVLLKGVVVAEGEIFTGMFMAINPGQASMVLPGNATKDPAFGLPAIWIEQHLRDQALSVGYTVVDASTVVATHLSHLIQSHAAELLGRSETQALLDHFAKLVPKVVEELIPKLISLSLLQKILQNLLEEGVALRDLKTILDVLASEAAHTQDTDALTAAIRVALGRSIVQNISGHQGDFEVMVLDPELEKIILNAMQGNGMGLEPSLSEHILTQTMKAAEYQENLGQVPVLLVQDRMRLALARMFKRAIPRMRVMSHSEIPEARTIRVNRLIGGRA